MKVLISLTLAFALALPLYAHAAETRNVVEIFACSLNEGKTWDDWQQVNARFGETVKKIGGAADDFNAFVWRPYRASIEFDYLWSGYFPNLRAWGQSMQAYNDSPLGEEADARWAELETCNSGLAYVEQIYDSPTFPGAEPVRSSFIESFRCKLQPGKSLADLRKAIERWHTHIASLDLPIDVFMRTPLVNSSDITHSYFAVHPDAASFGSSVSDYQTNPGTAAIDAMLAEVQSCTNALWLGERAFTAPE